MREIKFRGKDVETGEWRYGSLVKDGKDNYILEGKLYFSDDISGNFSGMYLVEEKTIGQYIGLKDKNGKEVYEGDILLGEKILDRASATSLDGFYHIAYLIEKKYCVVKNSGVREDEGKKQISKCVVCTYLDCVKENGEKENLDLNDYLNSVEVIGNIYDKPELILKELDGKKVEKIEWKSDLGFVIELEDGSIWASWDLKEFAELMGDEE